MNTSGRKVFRGGAWKYNSRNCYSSCRCSTSPESADNCTGFRVVKQTDTNVHITIQNQKQPVSLQPESLQLNEVLLRVGSNAKEGVTKITAYLDPHGNNWFSIENRMFLLMDGAITEVVDSTIGKIIFHYELKEERIATFSQRMI